MNRAEVIGLLDAKYLQYYNSDFIATDPIQIPHRFSKKEDIEIAAFFSATIAWGQRTTIIKNANRLMAWMDESPHDFILNFQDADLVPFTSFVHRTFNGDDCLSFLHALQRIYKDEGGLEKVMRTTFKDKISASGWHNFKNSFFSGPHLPRSRKHLPDPLKGSAAKRMNMFLRWMVRSNDAGVDFGLWHLFEPSELYLPLDVHTSRVSRKLKLLKRNQDDWKAVEELTSTLRKIDINDPVKYDFALFGLGAFEKF